MRRQIQRILGLTLLLLGSLAARGVELEVDGVGWLSDRRIATVMQEVLFGDDGDDTLRQFDVEDALLVINGELIRRGFLEPEITIALYRGEEEMLRYRWQPEQPRDLPELSAVTRLAFFVETGTRSYFEEVGFDGLHTIPEAEARSYFYPENALFVARSEKAFSPGALNNGIGSLTLRLAQAGYPEARVRRERVDRDPETGATRVSLIVEEGPLHNWGTVRYEWAEGSEPADETGLPPEIVPEGHYSRDAEQDLAVGLRNRFLAAGYPDVGIASERNITGEGPGQKSVSLVYRVTPGPRVRLAGVEFRGLEDTSPDFARSRTALRTDDWLSRLDVDRARSRLGRLGIFDQMSVSLEPPEDPEARTVLFRVEEGLQREINLLAGYGSYEQARVGAEMRFYNVFGRAHQGLIRLRQSMKSSAGQLSYSVPDLPWILERGQVRLQGLLREEVSFRREEVAVAIGVEQRFFGDQLNFITEYSLQSLRAEGVDSDEVVGDESARVGSITFGLTWDRRDRIVSPQNGFDLHSEVELASPVLGSEAHFQRLLFGGSYHLTLREGTLRLHFGFEHGILARAWADESELPFNKRFFPGGENSIRGYQSGEAAPRDSDGLLVGAETFTVGHAEVEFSVLRSLSVVFFLDGLHQARDLDDYPGDTTLWSAGGGLRYATPLGPLRLEYGHNLNPRGEDPSGTLHLSIGFPF